MKLNNMKTASDYLNEADACMKQRAALRDSPEGERSMESAVNAFNILTGHNLTETQGWTFMLLLKLARAKNGDYHEDDYTDAVAYSSLMAEASNKENT